MVSLVSRIMQVQQKIPPPKGTSPAIAQRRGGSGGQALSPPFIGYLAKFIDFFGTDFFSLLSIEGIDTSVAAGEDKCRRFKVVSLLLKSEKVTLIP